MVKSYVISCVGGIIFLTFAEFIAPRGKNGEAVRTVVSILAIAIIVVPVVSFLKSGSGSGAALSDGYFQYANKIDEKTRVYSLKSALYVGGLKCDSVSIEYDELNEIKSVLIFFDKKVIEDGADSINISEKAKEIAAKTLGISETLVGIEFNGDGGDVFERTG